MWKPVLPGGRNLFDLSDDEWHAGCDAPDELSPRPSLLMTISHGVSGIYFLRYSIEIEIESHNNDYIVHTERWLSDNFKYIIR